MLTLVAQNKNAMICIHIKDIEAAARVRAVLSEHYVNKEFTEEQPEHQTVDMGEDLEMVTNTIQRINNIQV